MDFESQSKAGKISLLTLPRTDLSSAPPAAGSSEAQRHKRRQHASNNNGDDTSSAAQLVLLKLPPGWSPGDIRGSHFVAPAAGAAAGSSKQQQQQAALVVESKRKSFAVHRVETSNVLVVVPPPPQQKHQQSSSSKRAKLTDDGKRLVPVPARLLSAGGSGASFLELREKNLSTQDLVSALSSHVFDPYGGNDSGSGGDDGKDSSPSATKAASITGRTVESLSHELQATQHEIQQGLKRIQAFPLPHRRRRGAGDGGDDGDYEEEDVPPPPRRYALLSEEVKLECFGAILSALAEDDDCQDYAVSGVDACRVVRAATERMSDEERFDGAEAVLEFCLETLADAAAEPDGGSGRKRRSPGAKDESKARIRLDLCKVAVCVARRLFQKQSQPWEEVVFLSRWQSELPGTTGDTYQVDVKMLRGVAVDVVVKTENSGHHDGDQGGEEEEVFWKYLPVESVDLDPSAGFNSLFAAKSKWLLDDLNPYMYRWGDESTHSDLLLRYTRVVHEQRDGVSLKLYTKA